MARTYEATFVVTVRLEADDEIITRTEDPAWKEHLYDLGEEGTVEMLARCLGIKEWRLTQMDGWADAQDGQARATVTDMEMEEYRRIN